MKQLILYFGADLDEQVYAPSRITPPENEIGVFYLGYHKLLHCFETWMGLSCQATNNEFLRVEHYRQAIIKFLEIYENPFFKTSFLADPLATAEELLGLRDELLLGGWDFEKQEKDLPIRLLILQQLEGILNAGEGGLASGFADRMKLVEKRFSDFSFPEMEIRVVDPWELLPPWIQRFLNILKENKVPVLDHTIHLRQADTDLGRFQKMIIDQKVEKSELKGDGSLLLVEGKRELDLASFLASFLRKNTIEKPLFLVPDKNRVLDQALIYEGFPSMGILSQSLARPVLQILRLATSFLWEPVDPFKIMEFASLQVKPLNSELGKIIAQLMARYPGIDGERWRQDIAIFFSKAKGEMSPKEYTRADKEYKFWFKRKRYKIDQFVPREEPLRIFEFIVKWAGEAYEASKGQYTSLLVLREQAKRIVQLLASLPEAEEEMSFLQLERLVRTIYEPAPVQFHEQELGAFPYVHSPACILEPASTILWWDFIKNEAAPSFPKWKQSEQKYLEGKEVILDRPARKNQYDLWKNLQGITRAQKHLLLIIPEKSGPVENQSHPLLGHLKAIFNNWEVIQCSIDEKVGREKIGVHFNIPSFEKFYPKPLKTIPPILDLGEPDLFPQREKESYSSLDKLFYFPHEWVLKYSLKLYPSAILSIVRERTMMGNLAHHVFEMLFNEEDVSGWSKSQTEKWIQKRLNDLFKKEGAVLLMFGREPEKIAFEEKMKRAAWSLISSLQKNNWKVIETEFSMDGTFAGTSVKGIADLVLARGEERLIMDLKWGGLGYRKGMIKSKEDLQLVMYSKLYGKGGDWPQTAYFIIEKGEILARNNQAFEEATAVESNADHVSTHELIWEKMEHTYAWRRNQIDQGKIEVRTKSNKLFFEEESEKMDFETVRNILEMKDEDKFDDFKILIGDI